MTLDRDSPQTLTRQIADTILQRIRAGEYRPGTFLPAEHTLAGEFHVARGTVREALAHLEREGHVQLARGRGWHAPSPTGLEPVAAYEKIAATLRDRLARGMYPPGLRMPSEAQLTREFNVSRNTVRRAYRLLRDARLVTIRQGSGVYPGPATP